MMGTSDATIYNYISSQEALYKLPIQVNDKWQWSMADHIRLTVLYSNSQSLNKTEFTPIKNIIRPILNLQHRATGFDVKDIVLYVDDKDEYYKSLLVKKYHERWARENRIDTFIDELVESFVDFGGALVKQIKGVRPEVVPLQSIAFCDQTDILSGPLGIKHFFSPDQLLAMADNGWGDPNKGATASLQDVINLSREQKKDTLNNVQVTTPGKYIEVYEVHGNLPRRYLDEETDRNDYVNQLQIVCFYVKDGTRQGVTLYRSEEKKSPFKFIKRDPIYGRALGMGGAEELFEAQVWTNYDMIRVQDMLDAASKTIIGVSGVNSSIVANRNKLRNMDNLSIVDLGVETQMSQIDTYPRNLKLFEENTQRWEAHAQQMGAANDSIMGENPTAGTPFKLQELVTQESHSLHEYRKGQIAAFIEEIWREWEIPQIARDITKGATFLAELDLDEIRYVNEAMFTCYTNQFLKDKILAGDLVEPEQLEAYKSLIQEEQKKQGTKRFLEILEGEMKSAPVDVKVNVAGKQKNLNQAVDTMSNIVRTIIQAGGPTALAFPGTWDVINQMIEKSGLDPVDFSGIVDAFKKMQQQAAQQPPQQPQPLVASPPANV